MTSVSPIPSWNASPSRVSGVTASRADAPAVPASTPSTIVAFGAEGGEMPAISYLLPSPKVWESPSRDDVSDQMTKNFAPYASFGGRFSGLGAALLDQLKGGVRNVSQALLQPPARTQPAAYAEVEGIAPASLHGNGQDKVSLSITTKSGVEVKLSLDSQDDGLAVRMTTSGELGDAEVKALGDLSEAFQQAIGGMAQGTPKVRLAGLMQFDQEVLGSVNLHAEVLVRGEPQSTQTLDFQADSTQRKVSFTGVAGSLDVKVDASQLNALGSKERQAKAMNSYIKQIDQASWRGHGDAALMSMFKDAFTAVHSNVPVSPASTGLPEQGKWQLAAADRAMVTGLPDFSASVTQTAAFSNPMRSSEKDGFQYELSQKTSITGASQNDRSIRQQQQSKLSASFHETLVPGVALRLTDRVESQNYTYHQIEDTASSDAQIGYKDGKLVKASLQQAASQSTHITKFMLGKVESDVTTPTDHSLMRDLVSVLGPYKTGEQGMTPEKKAEQREKLLQTLGDDVLLQSYAGHAISLWQADVLPAEDDKTAGAV
ncbi:hypothetical protein [Janthinobacterium sp. BJB301]|uniref:hypothetical protein n=1 Tax=Janthinobacterium sp. BJB301 TaxID=1560195 RepID=UPI00117B176F|nr:hypothetical protein [Janthinobacterium sp. BJB301]